MATNKGQMVVVKNLQEDESTKEKAIRNFLEKHCVKDRREISEQVHKQMMYAHFYYVDKVGQGWYVLDDPEDFISELSGEDYWAYGDTWEHAVAD